MRHKTITGRVAHWMLVAALGSGLIFTGCSGDTQAEAEGTSTSTAPGKEVTVNVSVQTLGTRDFASHLSLVGEVQSEYNALLSAASNGRLTRVIHDRGAQVAKGDTLLEIDSRQARSSWNMAQAALESAQLDFDTAKRQYDQGLGVSETDFRKIGNALRIAEAQASEASVYLENCFVIAPFAGVVDDRQVKLGELVAPGQPLLRLVDNQHLKVRVGVPENQAGFMRRGHEAEIRVTEAGLSTSGTVSWIASVIDTRDRTLPMEIQLRSGAGLKPGMLCEVSVFRNSHANSIVIPLSIVQQAQDHLFVYVEENGRAVKRIIDTADRDGDMVRISSGLQPGEPLIVKGFRDVVDGQSVRVVERTEG
ncbi:MAG: efflux RND transporter periplasmic adaptor subunit [Candidatus Cloacimonetes bacterium]|nr:efflux RND transporter periplasmic adaptor subunit [Candidatus Cloacimonadota bacterium]